ncbi:MAG: hypothetical protein Q8R48_04910, partial [Candidatus Omnitrophota bacterium]|nr:hypothetical protein [Candidatus Omnitrophota bacterium]
GREAALANIEAMQAFLMADVEYGAEARSAIFKLMAQRDRSVLETFVKELFVQRYNVDLQKTALTRRPYRGYDRVMVISSTDKTARFKEMHMRELFGRIDGVDIYSRAAEGFDEAGQILGIIANLERINAETNGEFRRTLGEHNMAIFPDAGLAERFSPMTQALDDQRGWQELLGNFMTGKGLSVQARLILGVMLNSLDFAGTSQGRNYTDMFWTSQQVAGTIPHNRIEKSSFAFQKFYVPIDWDVPKELLLKQLRQFGTIAIDKTTGEIVEFFGNQDSGAVKVEEGRLVYNKDNQYILDALKRNDVIAGFDFGSFRMNNALLRVLWNYWVNKTTFDEAGKEVKVFDQIRQDKSPDHQIAKSWKRDIDPDFTQPLTFLLQAIVNIRVF